jgi:hypothetical protein
MEGGGKDTYMIEAMHNNSVTRLQTILVKAADKGADGISCFTDRQALCRVIRIDIDLESIVSEYPAGYTSLAWSSSVTYRLILILTVLAIAEGESDKVKPRYLTILL